jgi:hypothetical protein
VGVLVLVLESEGVLVLVLESEGVLIRVSGLVYKSSPRQYH